MTSAYKLICLDLDGTLFNSERKISSANLGVLRRLLDEGACVALSTGRAAYDARRTALEIDPRLYFIAANGSTVGKASEPGYLAIEPMPSGTIRSLLAVCSEVGISPELFTPEFTLIQSFRIYLWHAYAFFLRGFRYVRHTTFAPSRKQFEKLALDEIHPVTKAFIYVFDHSKLEYARRALTAHTEFEMTAYLRDCFEITRAGVNKGTGIRTLIEHLGISREEVIAFGDSGNDYEMIKYAGCGVAMGNSTPEIIAVADRVTESNDDDGVARELTRVYGL
jgi:Cof subfamily protein (haloacid dehalogenase superfamily)